MNKEELEQTIKGLQENQDTAIKLLEENVELKKRIKEAIKYINWNYNHYRLSKVFNDKILNILQGDKEELPH